jgi:DNA-directed RNA polymerase subunit RPC12/RpoP
MHSTGEKPGIGTYQCVNCGTEIHLDDNTDTLPPCPKCDKTTFIKVG